MRRGSGRRPSRPPMRARRKAPRSSHQTGWARALTPGCTWLSTASRAAWLSTVDENRCAAAVADIGSNICSIFHGATPAEPWRALPGSWPSRRRWLRSGTWKVPRVGVRRAACPGGRVAGRRGRRARRVGEPGRRGRAGRARCAAAVVGHGGRATRSPQPSPGRVWAGTPTPTISTRPGRGRRRLPVLPRDPDVHVHLVMDLQQWLGLNDSPVEVLEGGIVPADVARHLARDATLRRIITDPLTGHLLDYGRTAYRPPEALTRYLRARGGTCRAPGCARAAPRCQTDHVQAWGDGGVTAPANTQQVCVRHRRSRPTAAGTPACTTRAPSSGPRPTPVPTPLARASSPSRVRHHLPRRHPPDNRTTTGRGPSGGEPSGGEPSGLEPTTKRRPSALRWATPGARVNQRGR